MRIISFKNIKIIMINIIIFMFILRCGGDGTGSEEGFLHVKMFDNVFIPPIASTPVGGKVRFVNIGSNPHNAISTEKKWSSESSYGSIAIPHGAFADITYPEEGDFPYYCSFHASPDGKVGMVGHILVGSANIVQNSEVVQKKSVETYSNKTRKVPTEYPSIQNAVDSAMPGDLILIGEGIFKEEVIVTTPSLIIRGTDRNKTILDGEFIRANGIMILNADGVSVQNMTFRNYTLNGVYWTGVKGYHGNYLTAYNNGDYGIYAFDSIDGLLENSYASGSPDSGFYIGQCYPCDAIIHNVISENNALGYSGTNSGGNLYILSSIWRNNFLGIGPNSLDRELLPPERETTLLYNLVYDNNNMKAPSHKLEFPSIGNGIAILGGIRNRIENNIVLNHKNYGISVVPNIDERLWLSNNNIVKNNIVFGSGRGDIALGGPVSFGNCFEENIFNHSSPVLLELFQGCDNFRYPYSADLSSTIGLLSLFVQVNMGDFEKISYKNQPIPPEQPTMPLELTKIIEPAIGMFEKSKKYIELAKHPEESDIVLKNYYALPKSYSSSLRPQFPQTFKTILFHIIGFLLPIGLYIAWVGTSIIDIVLNKNLSKEKSITYLIAILLIPYISAIYYLIKQSSISKSVRNTMILSGVILFLSLISYSIFGIISGGLPTQ
jgi:plastocyanin